MEWMVYRKQNEINKIKKNIKQKQWEYNQNIRILLYI